MGTVAIRPIRHVISMEKKKDPIGSLHYLEEYLDSMLSNIKDII